MTGDLNGKLGREANAAYRARPAAAQ